MYVDKRLAGIQAVQTLSRLNRAYPGKDTTYVLDFVNDTADVLAAFKTYYTTAELADVTDPNLVYNLRAKLDAAGHYDDFEVDRVVAVELKPNAKQSELVAAVEPVVDRLLKRLQGGAGGLEARQGKEGQSRRRGGPGRAGRAAAVPARHGSISSALHVPVPDLRLRQHRYRKAIDLLQARAAPARIRPRTRRHRPVQVVLTHHNLKDQGSSDLPLTTARHPKLEPITEAGGSACRKRKRPVWTRSSPEGQRPV